MLYDTNTTPIVFNGNRTISVNGYTNSIGIACHHFIYTIVDNFVYEMVKPTLVCRSNIHTGTHTYSFQAFENLDILSTITIAALTVQLFRTIRTSVLIFCKYSIIIFGVLL